jgi:ketosteroid isomerase-like protein
MAKWSGEELEEAFRTYWRTGAVSEDWEAWCDLFTEDALYVEHMYGTMRGREAIRKWIVPIMARYLEIYTAYEWHMVDPESGRVVVYMQNRRDHPSGMGTCDFPGITILEYAGGGKWKLEEDFYSIAGRDRAMKEYQEALVKYDPDFPKKGTRRDWGRGPEWTRGARSFAERPKRA